MHADTGSGEEIPLPNVTGRILAKIIEYCKFHESVKNKEDETKPHKTEDEVKQYDQEFMKVEQGVLFELILVRLSPAAKFYGSPNDADQSVLQAANYMHIEPLLDLACQTVANMIKGVAWPLFG